MIISVLLSILVDILFFFVGLTLGSFSLLIEINEFNIKSKTSLPKMVSIVCIFLLIYIHFKSNDTVKPFNFIYIMLSGMLLFIITVLYLGDLYHPLSIIVFFLSLFLSFLTYIATKFPFLFSFLFGIPVLLSDIIFPVSFLIGHIILRIVKHPRFRDFLTKGVALKR